VKVVSLSDYKKHIADLAAQGFTGQLTADPNDPNNLNRNNNLPGNNPENKG